MKYSRYLNLPRIAYCNKLKWDRPMANINRPIIGHVVLTQMEEIRLLEKCSKCSQWFVLSCV